MPADEANLVRDARRGNEAAFLTLYGRHRTALLGFAWRMTGSMAAAEDVIQECFLTLARGSAFDPARGRLDTYLFGVARHLVFRHLRVTGRETEELEETGRPPDALEDLLTAERSELVRQAIANLPVLQREAVILFEYEELSLEEIAVIAQADVGAIKARLRRARESLRKRLAPLLFSDTERKCI
jgi:RNA polymerase sigma-70 factor (ECF subfamily)